jgi:GxxExxY protein
MASYERIPDDVELVGRGIVDAALRVHKSLGPGLLESVYEVCLQYELEKAGFTVRRQVPLPIVYDGRILDAELRLDLVVNDCVLVEVKAVEGLLPVHDAQVLTYLKLGGYRLGFLINFNVGLLKNGIHRRIL